VTFLGIGGRDSAGAISAFARDFDLPFPNAIDRNFDLYSRFGVRIQDTWIFLNADGTETGRSLYEELSESRLRRYLDELAQR
jgi:hypothetical protein